MTRIVGNGPLRLSPDGRGLAVPVGGPRTSAQGPPGFIVISTDVDSREVFASSPSQFVGQGSLTWSADSRHILFRVVAGPEDRPEYELWSAARGTGKARKLVSETHDAFGSGSIQIAADGLHVVYTAEPDQRVSEIWSLDSLPGARPDGSADAGAGASSRARDARAAPRP